MEEGKNLRIAVIGDPGVGKTKLKAEFEKRVPGKKINCDGTSVELEIIDSPPEDDSTKVDGVLLVYDVSDKKNDSDDFEKEVKTRIQRIKQKYGDVNVIVIGNKEDLAASNVLSPVSSKLRSASIEKAGEPRYISVAAQTGKHVEYAFSNIARLALNLKPKAPPLSDEQKREIMKIKEDPKCDTYLKKLQKLKTDFNSYDVDEKTMAAFAEGEDLGFTDDTAATRKLLQEYQGVFGGEYSNLTNIHRSIFEQKRQEIIEKAPAEVSKKIKEIVALDISPKEKLDELKKIYFDYKGFCDVSELGKEQIREWMKALLEMLPNDNIDRYREVVGFGQAVGYAQDFSWIGPALVKELIETKTAEIKEALKQDLVARIKKEAKKEGSVLERLSDIRKIVVRYYEIPFLRDEGLGEVVKSLLEEYIQTEPKDDVNTLLFVRELLSICDALDEIDAQKQLQLVKLERRLDSSEEAKEREEIKKRKLMDVSARNQLDKISTSVVNQFVDANTVIHEISNIFNDKKMPAIQRLDFINLLLGAVLTKRMHFTPEQQGSLKEKLRLLSQDMAQEYIFTARRLLKEIDLNALSKKPEQYNDEVIKLQDTIERMIFKNADKNASFLSLKQWIYIARQCLREGDYHTAHVVIDALTRQPIQQLLKDPEAKKEREDYEQLRSFYRPPAYDLVKMAIESAAQDAVIVPSLYSAIQLVGKAQANKGDTTSIIEPLREKQARINKQENALSPTSFVSQVLPTEKSETKREDVFAYNLSQAEDDEAFKQYVEEMTRLEIVSRKDKTKALDEIKDLNPGKKRSEEDTDAVVINNRIKTVKEMLPKAEAGKASDELKNELVALIHGLELKLAKREKKEKRKVLKAEQYSSDMEVMKKNILYLKAFAKFLKIDIPASNIQEAKSTLPKSRPTSVVTSKVVVPPAVVPSTAFVANPEMKKKNYEYFDENCDQLAAQFRAQKGAKEGSYELKDPVNDVHIFVLDTVAGSDITQQKDRMLESVFDKHSRVKDAQFLMVLGNIVVRAEKSEKITEEHINAAIADNFIDPSDEAAAGVIEAVRNRIEALKNDAKALTDYVASYASREVGEDLIDEIAPRLNEEKACKALFPFNLGASHWVLGEVDFVREGNDVKVIFNQHDPLGGGQFSDAEITERFKEKVAHRLKENLGQNIKVKFQNVRNAEERRQIETAKTSCGAFTMNDLFLRAEGKPVGESIKDTTALRAFQYDVVAGTKPAGAFIAQQKTETAKLATVTTKVGEKKTGEKETGEQKTSFLRSMLSTAGNTLSGIFGRVSGSSENVPKEADLSELVKSGRVESKLADLTGRKVAEPQVFTVERKTAPVVEHKVAPGVPEIKEAIEVNIPEGIKVSVEPKTVVTPPVVKHKVASEPVVKTVKEIIHADEMYIPVPDITYVVKEVPVPKTPEPKIAEVAETPIQITEAGRLNQLNQELKDKINDFLHEFYSTSSTNVFKAIDDHFLALGDKIDKADLGFTHEQVKATFERLKVFVAGIERINQARDKKTPLEIARELGAFVEKNPEFGKDAANALYFVNQLAEHFPKATAAFNNQVPGGPARYVVKFVQWLPKYPLHAEHYAKLKFYSGEQEAGKELAETFKNICEVFNENIRFYELIKELEVLDEKLMSSSSAKSPTSTKSLNVLLRDIRLKLRKELLSDGEKDELIKNIDNLLGSYAEKLKGKSELSNKVTIIKNCKALIELAQALRPEYYNESVWKELSANARAQTAIIAKEGADKDFNQDVFALIQSLDTKRPNKPVSPVDLVSAPLPQAEELPEVPPLLSKNPALRRVQTEPEPRILRRQSSVFSKEARASRAELRASRAALKPEDLAGKVEKVIEAPKLAEVFFEDNKKALAKEPYQIARMLAEKNSTLNAHITSLLEDKKLQFGENEKASQAWRLLIQAVLEPENASKLFDDENNREILLAGTKIDKDLMIVLQEREFHEKVGLLKILQEKFGTDARIGMMQPFYSDTSESVSEVEEQKPVLPTPPKPVAVREDVTEEDESSFNTDVTELTPREAKKPVEREEPVVKPVKPIVDKPSAAQAKTEDGYVSTIKQDMKDAFVKISHEGLRKAMLDRIDKTSGKPSSWIYVTGDWDACANELNALIKKGNLDWAKYNRAVSLAGAHGILNFSNAADFDRVFHEKAVREELVGDSDEDSSEVIVEAPGTFPKTPKVEREPTGVKRELSEEEIPVQVSSEEEQREGKKEKFGAEDQNGDDDDDAEEDVGETSSFMSRVASGFVSFFKTAFNTVSTGTVAAVNFLMSPLSSKKAETKSPEEESFAEPYDPTASEKSKDSSEKVGTPVVESANKKVTLSTESVSEVNKDDAELLAEADTLGAAPLSQKFVAEMDDSEEEGAELVSVEGEAFMGNAEKLKRIENDALRSTLIQVLQSKNLAISGDITKAVEEINQLAREYNPEDIAKLYQRFIEIMGKYFHGTVNEVKQEFILAMVVTGKTLPTRDFSTEMIELNKLKKEKFSRKELEKLGALSFALSEEMSKISAYIANLNRALSSRLFDADSNEIKLVQEELDKMLELQRKFEKDIQMVTAVMNNRKSDVEKTAPKPELVVKTKDAPKESTDEAFTKIVVFHPDKTKPNEKFKDIPAKQVKAENLLEHHIKVRENSVSYSPAADKPELDNDKKTELVDRMLEEAIKLCKSPEDREKLVFNGKPEMVALAQKRLPVVLEKQREADEMASKKAPAPDERHRSLKRKANPED